VKVVLNAGKYLSLILWLVAIHSIVVGFSLILMPASVMPSFGFESYTEKFFPVQGGVFHLVMAVVYALAAIDTKRFAGLIILAIVAKFMATVFLLIYYFLVDKIWTVLFSAIGDCLMGTAILFAFLSYTRNKEHL
jgi:hypothetical protein